MTELEKQKLYQRNNKIIDIVLEQIKNECPDSVDLIGIGGSFCSGDIYENSDLDLVIIVNDEKARILNKCFILGNVGFDIYTQDWSGLETTAEYNNPYVTKLIDLDIVYKRNDKVLERYLSLQHKLKRNMADRELVSNNIGIHFIELLKSYNNIVKTDNISIGYKNLAKFISEIEYVIYMINNSYIKKGTKRIPEEISRMKILPDNFLEIYLDITNCSTLDEIKSKSVILIENVKGLLDDSGIVYNLDSINEKEQKIKKVKIKSENLTGTYEEIYSNYKNKMYHAVKTNNRYLSFMTMASCQSFYDEFTSIYDITNIDLIGKYNPNNLEENVVNFDKAMNEWKKLYDLFSKEIVRYETLEELNNLYKRK